MSETITIADLVQLTILCFVIVLCIILLYITIFFICRKPLYPESYPNCIDRCKWIEFARKNMEYAEKEWFTATEKLRSYQKTFNNGR